MNRSLTLILLILSAAGPAWPQSTTKLTCYPQGYTTECDISADGRYVLYDIDNYLSFFPVFEREELVLVDRLTGSSTTVGVVQTPINAPWWGYFPSFSRNGSLFLFSIAVGNDVQVMLGGERIDVNSNGVGGNGPSYTPGSVSSDGRFVVFTSFATNLVTGDVNGFADVFLRDRQNGTTDLVSVNSSGAQGNGHSESGAVSDDGRYIAFASAASNLVVGDTEGFSDVFLHDRQSGTTTRLSVTADGHGGNGNSCPRAYYTSDVFLYPPVVSADGNLVAFDSVASNLVANDTNGVSDVFVRDVEAGVTRRVSLDTSNQQLIEASIGPDISADGRFVSFSPGWVRDRVWNSSELVAVNNAGQFMYADTAQVSGDGRFVTFNSLSTVGFIDCQSGLRADGDIYLRDRGTLSRGFCAGDGLAVACPCGNTSPMGSGAGCTNSTGSGAFLTGTGDARLSNDSLELHCSGLPDSVTIFAQGSASIGGGIGVAFGDGLRCVGGQVFRLGVKPSQGGMASFPTSGDHPVSVGGNIAMPGTGYYQVRYRNAAAFCTSETFNMSNGLEVLWGP
jgi:hypothetical protein